MNDTQGKGVRRVLLLAAALTGAILLSCASLAGAQGGSTAESDNRGVEFWIAFIGNQSGTSELSLFITADQDASGVVRVPGLGFSQSFQVTAGQVIQIPLPATAQITTSDVVEDKGIAISALPEVAVFGLNQRQDTTDAFLALPTDILDREYINLTYPNTQWGGQSLLGSRFAVVATQDDTRVTITPSQTVGARTAGVPYSITLHRGQTYQLSAQSGIGQDLSGTIITADKPIAAFGGHQCTTIPNRYPACDHIVEQLFPVSTWGKDFVTMPLARDRGDTFRFVASVDNTVIAVNGVQVATLHRGQIHEHIVNAPAQITASHPIMVAQYSNSGSYDGVAADPFMMLVPPREQFVTSYTIISPPSGFRLHFVNILAPSAPGYRIFLDGASIPGALFTRIGTSGFSGARIGVSAGPHRLHSSLPFGVLVYGFDTYDSYGYPGGLSLSYVATVAYLTVEPREAISHLHAEHCITAVVNDWNTRPVADSRVDFRVRGVHSRDGFALTDSAGQTRYCYTGVQRGNDTITVSTGELTAAASTTWGIAPSGALGQLSCDAISGWAGDQDDPNRPVNVHLYADGDYAGGRIVGTQIANLPREAAVCMALQGTNCGVCPAYAPQCEHGFRFTNLPSWLLDGQPHGIYAYGLNLPGTGGHAGTLLAGSPRVYQCLPTATPTPTATTTPTPTATATPTVTPTATPTGPWAGWGHGAALVLQPQGAEVVIDYGNLTPPVAFSATLTGAAVFEDGSTELSEIWTLAAGSRTLRLKPAPAATAGEGFTLSAEIGDLSLATDGEVAVLMYLPLLLR